MPELVVIVPSRGRPHAVAELVEAFRETCAADWELRFAIDESEPALKDYVRAICHDYSSYGKPQRVTWLVGSTASMGEALDHGVQFALGAVGSPDAIAFMGDDHRPRTKGWDRAYLDALKAKPGIVYGNDLLQGENLPTQCAISTSVVRALGHMAPPELVHLYFDNYWLTLGRAADAITYLPDVVVEHVHPFAGKAPMDAGYERVNRPELYAADRAAFEAYWAVNGGRDIRLVREAAAAELAVARG